MGKEKEGTTEEGRCAEAETRKVGIGPGGSSSSSVSVVRDVESSGCLRSCSIPLPRNYLPFILSL